MPVVYIIKDKTDQNYRKNFVKIVVSESSAVHEVQKIQNKLNVRFHNLISYEAVKVSELDLNKNSIYVIYNKTDTSKSPIVDMCSSYNKACEIVDSIRKKNSAQAHKLIYMQSSPIQV